MHVRQTRKWMSRWIFRPSSPGTRACSSEAAQMAMASSFASRSWIAGWFIVENPIVDDDWGYPYDLGNPQMGMQFHILAPALAFLQGLRWFSAVGYGHQENAMLHHNSQDVTFLGRYTNGHISMMKMMINHGMLQDPIFGQTGALAQNGERQNLIGFFLFSPAPYEKNNESAYIPYMYVETRPYWLVACSIACIFHVTFHPAVTV